MATDDNSPAFPTQYEEEQNGLKWTTIETGLTKREWYEGKALAGILGSREMFVEMMHDRGSATPEDYVAQQCFKMADAMLEARK